MSKGKLSTEEFVQLVRLTARYLYWEVDQVDHWELPMPEYGPMFVDFNQGYPTPGARYRPMWPTAADDEPAWTVWRRDGDGPPEQLGRFVTEETARAHAAYAERPGSTTEVTPP